MNNVDSGSLSGSFFDALFNLKRSPVQEVDPLVEAFVNKAHDSNSSISGEESKLRDVKKVEKKSLNDFGLIHTNNVNVKPHIKKRQFSVIYEDLSSPKESIDRIEKGESIDRIEQATEKTMSRFEYNNENAKERSIDLISRREAVRDFKPIAKKRIMIDLTNDDIVNNDIVNDDTESDSCEEKEITQNRKNNICKNYCEEVIKAIEILRDENKKNFIPSVKYNGIRWVGTRNRLYEKMGNSKSESDVKFTTTTSRLHNRNCKECAEFIKENYKMKL